MDDDRVKTYQALVSCFSEFLIVAVHTILAERDLYPKQSFLKARKWNCAVFQSRHPGVAAWVEAAVAAVEKQLLKATVRQVSLVIFSSSSVPLERFVFNTSRFPLVSEADLQTPFSYGDHPVNGRQPDKDGPERLSENAVADLNAQFQGLLTRLSQLNGKLQRLPPKCTYTIAIEMRDKPRGLPPIEPLSEFIPSEPQLENLDTTSTRTTPLRSVDAGAFMMETWVEETRAKLDISADKIREEWQAAEAESNAAPEKPVDPLLEAMEGKTYVK